MMYNHSYIRGGFVMRKITGKSKSKTTAERHILVNIAIGSGSSLIITLLLLMILAAFTSSGKIPESFMGPVVAICCFVAAVIGTRMAIRKAPEKRLFIGCAQGAFMFVLVFAIGRATSAYASIGTITLAILAASLGGGLLGALGGRKRRRTVRR